MFGKKMMTERTYMGLDDDLKNGMTPTAKIILDAKVFGLIDDSENCLGWNANGISALYEKVSLAWEPHGLLPSRLPDDLRARHTEIFDKAIKTAKANGWDPEQDLLD